MMKHADFAHLHNHSQFSLLDGATSIEAMVKRAKEYNMPALALTDHGNTDVVITIGVAFRGQQAQFCSPCDCAPYPTGCP